jgi:hypothetical protein
MKSRFHKTLRLESEDIMSNKAIELYGVFKQWYRSPKHCSHVNKINGLSMHYINKLGFTDAHIQELIDKDVIEQYGIAGYKLTKKVIENFMNYITV